VSLKSRPKVSRGHGLPCSVAVATAALTAVDRATLDTWLTAPHGHPERRTDGQIAADLTAETGVRVSEQQTGRHRRRSCRCYQGTPKA
jgi:hypothetical protein